jgi:glycosyltransferase 2 family protein
VISAFALSWVVGFLVFPLPGGIGVREAVLVAVVPGASAAALLGASLAQRFLVLASEVAATVGNQVLARRDRRPGATASARKEITAGDDTANHPAARAQLGAHAENDARAGNVRTGPTGEAT